MHQTCGNVLGKGCQRDLMKYVGRRKGGEIKGIRGGGTRTVAMARKKDAHKEMCKSGTEVNKARYKNMKNQGKKVVAKAMKEQELEELREYPNKVFKLVKSMKKDGKDVEGGRCMRGSDGSKNFS